MSLPDVIDIPMGNPPCLKGLWKRVGDTQVISGVWAMSQKAHTAPNDTKSKFEITGVEKVDNGVDSPRGGAFMGWFDYQDSHIPRRIEDNGYLGFEKNRSGGRNIKGEFTNEFGRFTVTGTMSGTGRVEMFRIQKDHPVEEDKKSVAVRPARPSVSSSTGGNALNSSTSTSSRDKKSFSHTKGVKRPACSELKAENISPVKRIFSKAPVYSRKAMKEFVNKFRKKQHARSFLIPVKSQLSTTDYEAYLRVVEHPIDMGEISKKLDNNAYAKPDDFFTDLRLMMSNALKFHQVGSDFYALSLSIQKYIEDNIVQIQERLLSENMNKQTSTDSQTKQQPRVDQNIDGGLSEDSAVKARPLTEKEKEGLASSVAELFKVQAQVHGSDIDKAYSWVAWKFIASCLQADELIGNNGVIEIEVDKLKAVSQRQLQVLLEDWRESREASGQRSGDNKIPKEEEKNSEDVIEELEKQKVVEMQEKEPEKAEEKETEKKEKVVEMDVNSGGGEKSVPTLVHKDEDGDEEQTPTKEDDSHSDNELAPKSSTPSHETNLSEKGELMESPPQLIPGEDSLTTTEPSLFVITEPAGDTRASKLDVMNVDAWSETKETQVNENEGNNAEKNGSSAEPTDGWESARQEKLDKEKRELQRKTQEAKLVAQQRMREAKRAEALALEAEKARREREKEAESKREADKKKKEEEAATIAAKREADRKRRDDMEQEVDLDEVRGDTELMAMMNSSLG